MVFASRWRGNNRNEKACTLIAPERGLFDSQESNADGDEHMGVSAQAPRLVGPQVGPVVNVLQTLCWLCQYNLQLCFGLLAGSRVDRTRAR